MDHIEVPLASSWPSLLEYYHSFLEGKIDCVPTHDGPLEEESKKILPQLLKINEAGILTVDSQPGMKDPIGRGEIYRKGKMTTVKKLEEHQRAYLECYMPARLCSRLAKKLALTELLVFRQKYIKTSEEEPEMNVPVTIIKYRYKGKNYQEVESAMPTDSWVGPDMEFILENTLDSTRKTILSDLWLVRILDPVWGRESYLFDQILLVLK